MNQGPLTAEELEWLDDVLMKYGNDDAVIDASELDGMLTALLSGPQKMPPEGWLSAIWGGEANTPEWESEDEHQRFVELTHQHINDIRDRLSQYPEQFEPLFGTNSFAGEEVTVAEEWCYGYMKGVALVDWAALPHSLQPALQAIALHGQEENFSQLENMSPEEFERSIQAIRPAALSLYAKWLLH